MIEWMITNAVHRVISLHVNAHGCLFAQPHPRCGLALDALPWMSCLAGITRSHSPPSPPPQPRQSTSPSERVRSVRECAHRKRNARVVLRRVGHRMSSSSKSCP
jgi:hypothetical protein